ncbi:Swt1 family HEPN domain-containing protein [Thiobacillus thioparus]|uniref:Swt1 family HEPN domain-containing protein n=1 Tax=Thiobacillus thioparus TaxID=931 RepID=UPI00037FA279|nr:Swt1 family HEPN domain-containing protein [Thiobacillus thioparus]
MSDVDDSVRSFGMSGFLICDELRQIEQRFGIELGHVSKAEVGSAVAYYPQFEQSVRLEAADMSENYEVFYCLEQAIRKLIVETLEDSEGTDWWNSMRIAPDIKADVASLVKKERDNGVTQRSDNMIDYTTFGQLSGIITSNWDLFEPTLKNKRGVERVMANLNLLRGPIAHCCPMQEDEIDRLRLAVKDWFRMIG